MLFFFFFEDVSTTPNKTIKMKANLWNESIIHSCSSVDSMFRLVLRTQLDQIETGSGNMFDEKANDEIYEQIFVL